MTCVLYRKSSISLAFQTNTILRGCNLFIWYGFSDNDQQKNIIIDAAIIKKYLKTDLAQFDHTCISVDSADDIVSSMVYLGRMIFNNACKHDNFVQLLVENEYGDMVVFSSQRVIIHKHFIRSNEGTCFFYSSDNPFSFLGTNPKHCVISSTTNYSNKELSDLLNGSHINRNVDITCIDDVTLTAITFQGDTIGIPIRFSVSCRGQYAHQISGLPSYEKCSHLHGHTYKCRVSVFNSEEVTSANNFIKTLGHLIVALLNEAFLLGGDQQTTVENVARYIAGRLSQSYKLEFVELTETPNIMVRISFDD